MYDEDIIRPEIGSHEGRELTLMLAVEKPVVMFSDVTPPIGCFPRRIVCVLHPK